MVLIQTESTFTGKRPSIAKGFEGKKKMLEIFQSQKGTMLVEEPQPTTEEVTIPIVFSKKEEAELQAMVNSIR
jgi:hypothetical protein